jgi:hypothetical protein
MPSTQREDIAVLHNVRSKVLAAIAAAALGTAVPVALSAVSWEARAASHQDGTSGTSGDPTQPQPLSNADENTGGANGQCPGGTYCSTRDGSASQNGNGNANGKPCAGCVGKADNKNPPGQEKQDPAGTFPNNGYECDNNNGVGKTNPAHTGCASPSPSPNPY